MASMESNSVDAIVTDPPYGLAFMGVAWDTFNDGRMGGGRSGATFDQVGGNHHPTSAADQARTRRSENGKFQDAMTPVFEEALRVAKPGAHLLCFGGTRTFHRMTCAIEDAGWEIRDCIMWVYGSGFPKSMDVAKAIDKSTGYVGEVIGERTVDVGMQGGHMHAGRKSQQQQQQVRSLSDQAKEWEGWGTCLKPAWEPIIVARKPLEGTVAHNVMEYGTGAINIDGCRVPTNDKLGGGMRAGGADGVWDRPFMHDEQAQSAFVERKKANVAKSESLGRFPANLVHDGSDEVLALFPDSNCGKGGPMLHHTDGQRNSFGAFNNQDGVVTYRHGGNGSAARFFYCAKASKSDRNHGCEELLTWAKGQELAPLLDECDRLLKVISGCGMPNLEDIECSTSSYGSSTTVLSRTECKCIMSTVTRLTTGSKTSDSSRRLSTSDSILDAIRTIEASGTSVARLAERLSQSKPATTNGETDIAINAVVALFSALSEIRGLASKGNLHPTIKPTALMQWLVRLVCPVGGTVLDPFCGSGSTGVACVREGMGFVGIEREKQYAEISERRIDEAAGEHSQGSLF